MTDRRTSRADFEEFVAVCSGRLLRTTYLLVRDQAVAERLLQDALARAWLCWRHLDEQPEAHVRRLLVRSALKHPVPAVEGGDALWDRLGRLSRRQRAVVVLRHLDELPEDAVAELVGCSVSVVRTHADRALAALDVDPSLAAPTPEREGVA